ncbi:SCO6745 family protein [Ornithinimicrobium pekingense]|uniref:SalK n=1 Tax=Ornithinimicrobium pekingense TaxID=384677 RepID=A0ABQ2F676_9MICO|nr:hypothetical protein [Ornithinimicrobium pekingense]GGK64699.1 hypothetical protein GCM10011509_11270 [Ornithinimicrobium pekingense]
MTAPGDVRRSARQEAERTLWRLVEAFHAVVYFAPQRSEVYSRLGLRGGWMGYFASRSAALGVVPPDVVTACFYGFAPRMVHRALPDAWRRTTPEQVLDARLSVVDRAVRPHLEAAVRDGEVDPVALERVVEQLTQVVGTCSPAGAPLFAAHRALARPDEPHLALFWAATALRELHGDAHVSALRAAGLGPVGSNVLMVALGRVPTDHRLYRGWTEEEWGAAAAELTTLGWLQDGHVTPSGRRRRAAVEDTTDAITAPAWAGLEDDPLTRLVDDVASVVRPVVAGCGLPYPNGTGVLRALSP